jgi:GntR family transcriptional regulator, rspAB operon transcriptional repressor
VSRTIALDPGAFDLETPARLLVEMHAAWDREDKPTFIERDLGYHRAMFRTTGHEGLWELVKHRSGNVDRLRNLHLPTPGKAAQILADHHAHLDALRAGDEVGAQAVIRRHLTGTLRAVNEIREAHRPFFS